VLVRAGIVVVLSILLHEGRPALVKHARQDDKAAEPDVKLRGGRWVKSVGAILVFILF